MSDQTDRKILHLRVTRQENFVWQNGIQYNQGNLLVDKEVLTKFLAVTLVINNLKFQRRYANKISCSDFEF